MAEQEEDKNPFSIELVIDNISKYLTFKELKVCRRLNHLWKKTTNKTFLKRCPPLRMIFRLENDNIYATHLKMTIAQFMEIYSEPNHPHAQAQLLKQYRNFFVYRLAKEGIPIFYNFMAQVGPQMTLLKLVNVQVLRTPQDWVDILSSKYTPNLEVLQLRFISKIKNFEPKEETNNYQHNDGSKICIKGKENKHLRQLSLSFIKNKFQWLDVLSVYPKLKTLYLSFLDVHEIEEIATGLVSIRKGNETKLKLAELKISNIGDTEGETKAWQRIGDMLKAANLPLEKLCLVGTTSEFSLSLFQHYRENLKSLTLSDIIPQPFPVMEALQEMDVEICSDLTFLNKVPNLKSLSVCRSQHSLQTCFPESPPNLLLSLTKFKSDFWKDNVSQMERLLLRMPNVQNLEVPLNNSSFSRICQHLPNLKELTVLGEELDDSGVVGDFDGAFFEGCCPNITNLKALETFKMGSSAVVDKGLTEKSVFYGFSLMPKLSNLDINVKSELSADAMLALHRGIKNVRVNIASK